MPARLLIIGALAAFQATSTLEVEVNLVNVFVTVQDENGAHVRGLTREDFRLYESGVERPIEIFESDEERPSSLGVLIDTSGSSADVLRSIRSGVAGFVADGGPDEEAFVMAFGAGVDLIYDYGEAPGRLERRLDALRSWGTSVFFDALAQGIEKADQGRRARKALVVLSDGADNRSRTSYREVVQAAQRSSVLLYFVGLGPRVLVDTYTLEGLAAMTGGGVRLLGADRDVRTALDRVREDLTHQYHLGYYASDTPGYHPIRVETPGRTLTVRAREGYWVGP